MSKLKYAWCAKDKSRHEHGYRRTIWQSRPVQDGLGAWTGTCWPRTDMVAEAYEPGVFPFLEALFPKNVRPGQCVRVELKRLEVAK